MASLRRQAVNRFKIELVSCSASLLNAVMMWDDVSTCIERQDHSGYFHVVRDGIDTFLLTKASTDENGDEFLNRISFYLVNNPPVSMCDSFLCARVIYH